MEEKISLSAQHLSRLIAAYREAKNNKKASFKFQGVEFLTTYAFYFLKYWAPKFRVEFEDEL